jgi:hypothetical protein
VSQVTLRHSRRTPTLLAALALVLAPVPAIAAGPFDVIISTGESEPYLYIRGAARVLVEGGHVSFLNLFDGSYGEVTGGDISHLEARQNSSALIQGGVLSHLRAYHSASVELAGGEITHVTAYDDSRIDIRGGGFFNFATAAGADSGSPATSGSSVVNVYGGSVGVLRAQEGGVANMFGGQVSGINPFDGVTNVRGGTLLSATLNPGTVTNAYGRDFHLELTGHVFGTPEYLWTGVLSDGTPLNAQLTLPAGAILNLIEIPEPTGFIAALTAALVLHQVGRQGQAAMRAKRRAT